MVGHKQGQSKMIHTLTRAMIHDRLSHAYLFTGGFNEDLQASVMTFAQTLICSAAYENRPCGQCANCQRFLNGTLPDFIHIKPEEGAGTIKIRQIRGLIMQMANQTFDGGLRICLITEAEKMTDEAQNALLKSLEEPAPGNIFLLTATRIQGLLPTIRSRCQVMNLSTNEAFDSEIWNETFVSEAFSVMDGLIKGQAFPFFALSEKLGKDKTGSLQVAEAFIRLFEALLKTEKTGIRSKDNPPLYFVLSDHLQPGQAEGILEVLFELVSRMQTNVNLRLQWERTFLLINEILHA